MLPSDFHDLFIATAGVAGTLVGLLFVAISVARDREEDEELVAHRIRATAALTSFTNSLTVSLFALVPGVRLGTTAAVASAFGLIFVIASLLSIWRLRAQQHLRDSLFLGGMSVVFVVQMIAGLTSRAHPQRTGPIQTLAILVIVCFLFGIARSWELIGGPSVKLTSEIGALAKSRSEPEDES